MMLGTVCVRLLRRDRLRVWFERYNDLANGVLSLLDVAWPTLDLTGLRLIPQGVRRVVSRAPEGSMAPTIPDGTPPRR